ncbi:MULTISPECIES: peptidoglycan-binding domain-containing protein [Thiomicrorhabdus]|uniref:Peptidoglycan-binding protein n=1 Tax=Thiomicrorhabdus heinhorstiae TaxID=2748010 RepID=A0ABS0BVX2_9GAMM|nr:MULTISPECIES: peptidoglycan-binding domain-containing protein [Thiomicrorhabdus]MBF6056946.1 peptidoglycan-binding protein [Thiomicrorhabdus heinhorstiae]
MKLLKLSALSLAILSLTACETFDAFDDSGSDKGEEVTPKYANVSSAADIDLLIERAKAEERTRVEAEYARQKEQQEVFARLKRQQGIAGDKPPYAEPGKCYAKMEVPALYQTVSKRVPLDLDLKISKEPEYEQRKILISPEKQIVDKVIPAEYKTVSEKVLVTPETKKINVLPAVYKDVEEYMIVSPAREVWVDGPGNKQEVDPETGKMRHKEIVPAEYKKVKRRVMLQPERKEEIIVPAVYKTVEKKIKVKDEQTVYKKIPAEYKTVSVPTADPVSDKQETKYKTVVTKEKVTDVHVEWRELVCKEDLKPDLVEKLQKALAEKGYLKPSPPNDLEVIDGIWGPNTLKSLEKYQQDQGLPSGKVTMESLKQLGVIN